MSDNFVKRWMPILKSEESETGYIAILSDTDEDRDGELMGKSVLQQFVDNDYLPGFIDHDTNLLNKVCKWINRRVIEKDGVSALVAEPKWLKSNPKTKIVSSKSIPPPYANFSSLYSVSEFLPFQNAAAPKRFTAL